MKKSLIVAILASATLLGGCAGKSDPNQPVNTTANGTPTQRADCSKLDGVTLKAAKFQQTRVLGWSNIAFKDGSISSVSMPAMPALSGAYSCNSSMFDGTDVVYSIGTNIGQVTIVVAPNAMLASNVSWTHKTASGDETVLNTYIRG
jgi:hypothetical protein